MQDMNRRTFLATVGTSAGVTAIAGCTQVSRALPGCSNMDSTTVDVASVSLSDEQLSHLFPLVYSNLQADYQQIIDKAGSDGRYKACPPIPDAVDSFVALATKRIDRQWNAFGGNPDTRPEYLQTAYLRQDDKYFELQITVEDLVVS